MTSKTRGGQRKYTVGEIDRMRRATWAILNAQWGKGQWQQDCEDRLRTYMLNNTSPQEVERAAASADATRVAGSLKAFLAHDPATDLFELAQIVAKGGFSVGSTAPWPIPRPKASLMDELGLEGFRARSQPGIRIPDDFPMKPEGKRSDTYAFPLPSIKEQGKPYDDDPTSGIPAVYDSAAWTGRS